MRRRRSVLWVPGDQPRKVERSATAGADVVVLDLEDGVAPDRKVAARDVVAGALAGVDFGAAERVVRINGGPDLPVEVETVAAADAVFVPKVRGAQDLVALCGVARDVLDRVPPLFVLWAETPAGLLSAHELLAQGDDVAAWMWGSEDLAAALGARPRGPGEDFEGALALARSTTVALAAATERQAIDTVYPFYQDLEGLEREAQRACALGFTGKGLIHPAQIEPVHEAFRPSDDELSRARAIVAAFAGNPGVASLNGQMLDRPHLLAARATLSRAGEANPTAEGAACD